MATDAQAGEVAICNLALNGIGQTEFIESLDPSDSDAAAVCVLAYPQCRDEVLEAIELPFTTRRARPAKLDPTTLDLGEVPDGWCYAFALPADCLPNGLRRIYPCKRNPQADEEIPFDVEYDGKTDQAIVLTDLATPEFIYTVRVTNTARFPPTLKRCIAERLACDLIRGIRKDARLLEQQLKVYAGAESTARVAASRATNPMATPPPFFIADRG